MSSKYNIRPATRVEIPSIINIAIQSQADEPIFNHIFLEWAKVSKEPLPHYPEVYQWFTETATTYFDSGRLRFYVAFFNDRMVGYIAYKPAIPEVKSTIKTTLAVPEGEMPKTLPPGLSKTVLEAVLTNMVGLDKSYKTSDDNTGSIVSMGVLNGYRRSTIGQRLLTQCTHAAKLSNNIVKTKCSDAVIGFFEDHGFVKVSSVKMLKTQYHLMIKKPL